MALMVVNFTYLIGWVSWYTRDDIQLQRKYALTWKYIMFIIQSSLVYASFKKKIEYVYPLLYVTFFRILIPLLDIDMRSELNDTYKNVHWMF